MGVNVSKHVMPNAASRTNICMHAETILEIVESSPDGAYREVLKTIEPCNKPNATNIFFYCKINSIDTKLSFTDRSSVISS